MDGVIDKLREAMSEFDGCTAAERGFRVHAAMRVLRLVRELLSEVDGARREAEWVEASSHPSYWSGEPLGGPVPGVDGSHLPD